MSDKIIGFHERFCALCNKMIFPTADWVYKIRVKKEDKIVETKYYCSYKCWREAGGGSHAGPGIHYGKRR